MMCRYAQQENWTGFHTLDMKCLITDDHALIREGIRHLLEEEFDEITVLETGNGHDVMAIIDQHPDTAFILLDFYMPGIDGLVLLKMITDSVPDIPVIVVSATENSILMRKVLDAGASGFIPKSSTNEVIINAIHLVLSGGIYVPPVVVSANTAQSEDSAAAGNINVNPKRAIALLTDRQKEVLKLIAQGKTNKDIAQFLDLSANTVKVHVTAVLQILHVTNRTEAVVMAQQLGLIE